MVHKITKLQPVARNCFVCGVDNAMGLHTHFYETESSELIAVCTPKPEHQSYPGRLHGGVSSALLDETIGRAICISHGDMVWGVTVELKLKYRKPVPCGEQLRIVGRITADRGRLFEGSGEIYLPSGEVAVEAKGLYMKRHIEQIAGADFAEKEWGIYLDLDVPKTVKI